jgi:hypothetical protein
MLYVTSALMLQHVFLIGEPVPVPGLISAPVQRWYQLLEHLCAGHAFDQVECAIRRQTCTLLYGEVWLKHQAEMRARFPEAVWIRTSSSLGDDGPYMPLEAFAGPLTPLPCVCAKALVDVHCDFMESFAASSNGFMQHSASAKSSLYIDPHIQTANAARRLANVAYVLEPYTLQGHPNVDPSVFARIYTHGASGNPVVHGGGWIPSCDYKREHAKQPKAGIILSHKRYMPGHAFRHAVVAATVERGDVVASGTGVGKHLACKTAGIAPFMYAIVIENCVEDGYWTEKLVDSLLLKCVVFYWGAPNVHAWFAPESVIAFSTLDDLLALLNCMSTDDYVAKTDAIERNYHRAQAWIGLDDGILLGTDFMSTAAYDVTACACVSTMPG